MKTIYKPHKFQSATLDIINKANNIIEEYVDKGFSLTVRQLYYQFVARGWLDNTMKCYNNLDMLLGKARLAGLIDWDAIEDRVRTINQNSHWDNPQDIIESAAHSYALDSRDTQDNYVEVWIEKNALLGVIAPICKHLDVLYLACIGYYSLSAMYQAAGRIRYKSNEGKRCVVLHLGDHDPSGIDMTRDIQDRLKLFGCDVRVRRIALTMNQIEDIKPPANPAKITDSRYDKYLEEYGSASWELDALPPEYIAALIDTEVGVLTNKRRRNIIIKKQEEDREKLLDVAGNWDYI